MSKLFVSQLIVAIFFFFALAIFKKARSNNLARLEWIFGVIMALLGGFELILFFPSVFHAFKGDVANYTANLT